MNNKDVIKAIDHHELLLEKVIAKEVSTSYFDSNKLELFDSQINKLELKKRVLGSAVIIRTKISNSIFTNTDMGGMLFYENQFFNNSFHSCYFRKSEFKDSVFKNTVFLNCNLSKCEFINCQFVNCQFTNCDFGWSFIHESILDGGELKDNKFDALIISDTKVIATLLSGNIFNLKYPLKYSKDSNIILCTNQSDFNKSLQIK